MSEQSPHGPTHLTTNPILWGAYLACSWTWCIGMFFPILLLRDFGWVGVIAFAIPNIIGAAAMGWVLRSRESSIRFAERHTNALWWFSTITIGFHIFWIIWLTSFIREALAMPDEYLFGAGAIAIAFALSTRRFIQVGKAPQLAMLLWALSAAVLVAMLVRPEPQSALDALVQAPRTSSGVEWFIPVSIFGFLLCPYLDITFHHARQNLPTQRAGRIGFTIGFGVFFALMILLTVRYAGVIEAGMQGTTLSNTLLPPWLAAGVLTHLLCQWIFTVRVHLNRMATLKPHRLLGQQTLFLVALISGLAGFAAPKIADYAGLSAGEIGYRGFMSFYGLVFPAYVLYRVIRAHSTEIPLQRWMMWLAIGVAMPMFWMGFIERQSIWLGPGMVIVICGAFVLKGKQDSTIQV